MATDTELEKHGLELNLPNKLTDSQPDDILEALHTHVPVTSERNVWLFWDKGFQAMPPWIQRSVVNSVRRQGHCWTFRLLDIVPGSPNHVQNFVDDEDLPACARDGRMTHADSGQHIADLARVAVVYLHGGIYMDAGMMLLRDLDEICWAALGDPNEPYEVAGMMQPMGTSCGSMMNSFIAARKHNPFLYRWKQVFVHMWKDRKSAAGLHDHPLVRHLPLLRINAPSIPADLDWAGFTDYVAQIQAYERVRLNCEPGVDGFDGPAYFRQHFFLLHAGQEMFRNQAFDGAARVIQLLLLPRDSYHSKDRSERDNRVQEEASGFFHDILARSSVCKFSKGTGRLGLPALVADHLARPEHAHDDCQPGTWGEYLRYGSVHLRQTRAKGRVLPPLHIPDETARITHVGMLEPVFDSPRDKIPCG